MKTGYGAGAVVAVLISFAAFLFGAVDYKGLLSLLLLLVGLWTVVAGVAIVPPTQRMFYSSWGVVLAVLSATYFVSLRYALGLVLVAVVILILISLYGRSNPGKQPQAPPATRPA